MRGNYSQNILKGRIEVFFINSGNLIFGQSPNFNMNIKSMEIEGVKSSGMMIKAIRGVFNGDKFSGYGHMIFQNGSHIKGIIKDNKLCRNSENIDSVLIMMPENKMYRIKEFNPKNPKRIKTFEDKDVLLDELNGILEFVGFEIPPNIETFQEKKNKSKLTKISEENEIFSDSRRRTSRLLQ